MNIYQSANRTNNSLTKNTNRSRFQGKCNHCGKWRYRREDCWFLKNNQFRNAERANVCMPEAPNVPGNGVEEEIVLINEIPTVR